jgi:glycosyltransferase involved in cell wall biosynthesis
MKISFVIPVFNEEESLVILYREILENLNNNSYEIIFIDDGSFDKSYEIIKNIADKDKNVKAVKFRRNFGKAEALQTGFSFVSGEIVFTMDADLQDNPIEIPRFIEQINEGYDLVSGWKKKRHDPLSKKIPSKFFNFITSKAVGLKLKDFNCGFKAYKYQVVKELDIYGDMHRYIPALAFAKGFKIKEIVVEHRERKFGKSKYGIERYLRGFFDLLTVKLITGFTRSPLYLFGKIGLFLSGIGFVITSYLSYLKIFDNVSLSNRPMLSLGVLLILAGLQFFSIGLIGELLVNQTRKINKQNNISISDKINL